MTPEEILRPRYKVIDNWPGNTKFEIGDILKGYSPGCGGGDLILNDKGESVWLSPEKYPHLFKKLEWWEDRKESELPEYVKWVNSSGSYINHITGWNWTKINNKDTLYLNLEGKHWTTIDGNDLPATKEEYENQNKDTKNG